MNNFLISLREVVEFLENDKNCSEELKKEVLVTLDEIQAKDGRKWVATLNKDKYYIDEYNEHNDFVKTYTFKI